MNTEVDTYTVRIYMAGDIDTAKAWLRKHCYSAGCCVTVTPTAFIYTGGEESGFVVGFVNYPKFPTTPTGLLQKALSAAKLLAVECCQRTALVVAPDTTQWVRVTPPADLRLFDE